MPTSLSIASAFVAAAGVRPVARNRSAVSAHPAPALSARCSAAVTGGHGASMSASACPRAARRVPARSLVSPRAQTVISEEVTLSTPTGPMRCEVYRPSAPGKYPGLTLFSEIFQITGPIRRSAIIMAGHGYLVIVPEIYHEHEKPNTALAYDTAGADRGNLLKITKDIAGYDADSAACVTWLQKHALCTGKIGCLGFCIGGHLAFRGAMNKGVLAAAVMYPTDIHKGALGKGGDNSLARIPEFVRNGTELLLVFGRADPHVPVEGRRIIHRALEDGGVHFSWLEFNAQHAFMRDEGPRYDPDLSHTCYRLFVDLFRRKLGEGDVVVPAAAGAVAAKVESKH